MQLDEELVQGAFTAHERNVHAIALVRKLVQKGASATMKSAICQRRLLTFNARKYATGNPKRRQAKTAISAVTNDDAEHQLPVRPVVEEPL